MNSDLQHIIQRCKQNDPKAQRYLFDQYAGLFKAIARRYVRTEQEAEDVLVVSFYKILDNIKKYKGEGSFEGWMKRIVINESLMSLRKKHALSMTVELSDYDQSISENVIDEIQYGEIIEMLDELSPGYRTVFNLYVIEGYKHKEIAEILNISINTSKSQLILAKKRLREIYKKKVGFKTQIS